MAKHEMGGSNTCRFLFWCLYLGSMGKNNYLAFQDGLSLKKRVKWGRFDLMGL